MARTHPLSKVALLVGYLAVAGAVIVAHRHPTTGFELSIYAATPALVWAAVAVALLVAVAALFATERGTGAHSAALALTTLTVLVVLAVPILRGYTFYGPGDSMSHVGWAWEIATGRLSASNLLYPGIHVTTVFISRVAGVPLTLASLYLVLVGFSLVFMLFVPLAVQLLADTRSAYAVGLVAAALFVPINNISLYTVPHPATQAILFFAALLFLALSYTVRYARESGDGRGVLSADGGRLPRVTGIGVFFALSSLTILFIHPQQALNAAFCLGAIAGFQLLVGWLYPRSRVAEHRSLVLQAGFLVAAFAAWAPQFSRVQGAVLATVLDILRSGPQAGEVVGAKTSSLTAVGGTLPALFAKLFLTATVFSLLAAVVLAAGVGRRFENDDTNTLVRYFAAGLVPLAAVFIVVLVSQSGDMYFRYEGFIMVPITILGAAALARGLAWLRPGLPRNTGRIAVAFLFAVVLLPSALLTVHASPYMYQPSKQVTQGSIDGYETAFAHREPGIRWVGIRGGPQRYVDLYYGTHYARKRLDFPGYKYGIVNSTVFTNASYGQAFDGPRYFPVTQSTYEKEVGLYRGFRYPVRGFRELETTPGVNRIETGGGFRLYYVENRTRAGQ